MLAGPTIVVSPLIALQNYQVEAIDTTTGDDHRATAVAINSSSSAGATQKVWQQLENGHAEYVFLAPEQLAKNAELLGDLLDEPCGDCDRCSAGTADEASSSGANGARDTEFPPQSQVEHRRWGTGTVMSTEDDRITVFFEREGYKVVSIEAIRESGRLSAGDA